MHPSILPSLGWSGAWLLGALAAWALWHAHVRPHPVRRRYARWYLVLVLVVALFAVGISWVVRPFEYAAPFESDVVR